MGIKARYFSSKSPFCVPNRSKTIGFINSTLFWEAFVPVALVLSLLPVSSICLIRTLWFVGVIRWALKSWNTFRLIGPTASPSKILVLNVANRPKSVTQTVKKINLDFPSIKKLKKSLFWILNLNKSVQIMLLLRQYYFLKMSVDFNGIFLLFQHKGKSRFSKIPPTKVLSHQQHLICLIIVSKLETN